MPTRALLERLADLPDPRDPKGRLYPFVPLLALCLVAILAGNTSVAAIAQFGRLRGKRLGHALGFTRGRMPCANTPTNLLAALDADALDRVLGAWLADRHAAGWTHVALDGKVLKGSRDGQVPGVHLLAAYAPQASAVLAQLRVEASTNEHKAALRLLGVLPPLAGAAVTADAMFTHADVCDAVLRRGGNYVLYAKDNQTRLQADLAEVFAAAGGFSPQGPGRLAGGCPGGRRARQGARAARAAGADDEHLAERLPDGLAAGAAGVPPGAAANRGRQDHRGGGVRDHQPRPGGGRRGAAVGVEPGALGDRERPALHAGRDVGRGPLPGAAGGGGAGASVAAERGRVLVAAGRPPQRGGGDPGDGGVPGACARLAQGRTFNL
jgi:DDE_Tnp_1-associated/Transposase DDE domain